MIERIFSEPQLPERGIEAQKIRALFQAYGTGYDFCRFYKQGSSILAFLDGSCVLYCDRDADFSEISSFLAVNGYTDLFCSAEAAKMLNSYIPTECQKVISMKFIGEPLQAAIEETNSLIDLYGIISTGFDIDFEPWYLDMSHRIRHGVTRAFLYKHTSALVVQHNINGEALLSQIAVLPDSRGKGYASKLIRSVCSALLPSDCYVLCEPRLKSFYEKVGFIQTQEFCILTPGAS
ncbi:MAG: GNAT family N-acetyltransferase [Oscillospiraceae bacterium]